MYCRLLRRRRQSRRRPPREILGRLAGLDVLQGHEFGAGCIDLGFVVLARPRSDRRRCGARERRSLERRPAFRAHNRIAVQVVKLRAAIHALALQAEFRFGHGLLALVRDRASDPVSRGVRPCQMENAFAGLLSNGRTDRRSTPQVEQRVRGFKRVTTRRAHDNDPRGRWGRLGFVTCRTLNQRPRPWPRDLACRCADACARRATSRSRTARSSSGCSPSAKRESKACWKATTCCARPEPAARWGPA